jgi:hypothetical protein
MIKPLLNLSLCLICLVLLNTACFFSTSSTTVKGFVVDTVGTPIPDAKILFGGTLGEVETQSDAKGFFTMTAKHRPGQMLRLKVTKKGYGMMEKVEFPGFAAPTDDIKVKMIHIIGSTR